MHGAKLEENLCVIFEITGLVTRHDVALKETLTLGATAEKKVRDKEERKRKVAQKVASLAAAATALRAAPEMAPNPAAAIAADGIAPTPPLPAAAVSGPAVGGGGEDGAAAVLDVVFAQIYGAGDVQAAAQMRGDNEFLYQEVDEDASDESIALDEDGGGCESEDEGQKGEGEDEAEGS